MTHKSDNLTGAEKASQEKNDIVFKSRNGVQAPELKLPAEDMAWWRDAKFGMFIHWGLYAIPGRGEWVMHNDRIPAEEYARLADQFIARHFDAAEWAAIAAEAGMNYMVLTSRHHDGFALWNSPSSYGGFCSGQQAAKRDFIAEYTDACRQAGLGVGIYYSPMDWRFPGYFNPREMTDNAALMKQQAYGQIEELMSNYGTIDILWYDGGWLAHSGTDADAAWFWEPIKLNTMVRELQPKIVINPRSGWEGDFNCDEGNHEITGPIVNQPWEKCLNLNRKSWGYSHAQNLMSAEEITRMLLNVVGRGGNVLLNVGPDPDGIIPPSSVKTLKQVGNWMRQNGEGIYGTRAGPLQPVDQSFCSVQTADAVYIYVLNWQTDNTVRIPRLDDTITSADLLSANCQIEYAEEGASMVLSRCGKPNHTFPEIVKLLKAC